MCKNAKVKGNPPPPRKVKGKITPIKATNANPKYEIRLYSRVIHFDFRVFSTLTFAGFFLRLYSRLYAFAFCGVFFRFYLRYNTFIGVIVSLFAI